MASLPFSVACLGLFGLVTFTAEQRVKEIGVRKVLGADVFQIVSILSKDLLLLVAVSFVIAFPLGFYLMDKWLQGFAYKIDIPMVGLSCCRSKHITDCTFHRKFQNSESCVG
ncbi:MAG: FtsX-like permease family protein [Cytophagales bacterium]|nr:FtsX-like permease family protein [Cytophagales bacterium]